VSSAARLQARGTYPDRVVEQVPGGRGVSADLNFEETEKGKRSGKKLEEEKNVKRKWSDIQFA
jgi:hypothetical protein